MKKDAVLIIAVFFGLVLLLLSNLTFATTAESTVYAQEDTETDQQLSDEELIEQGEMLYNNFCATCHQAEGQGVEGGPGHFVAPLDGNQLVLASPEGMLQIILNGYGPMPNFHNSLSDEEIAAVVSYIRNAWSNEASVVQPETVAEVAENK